MSVSHHRQQRPADSVRSYDVCLYLIAVTNLSDIPNPNWRTVHHPDREVVQLIELSGTAVELNLVLLFADLRGAGRQDQILQIKSVRHISRRELFGVECLRIQIDGYLTVLAAERKRH